MGLTEVASLVAEHWLQILDWVVVVHRLLCPVACGIFTDQGLDPCALHWQMESYPLDYQGSPRNDLVLLKIAYLEDKLNTQNLRKCGQTGTTRLNEVARNHIYRQLLKLRRQELP